MYTCCSPPRMVLAAKMQEPTRARNHRLVFAIAHSSDFVLVCISYCFGGHLEVSFLFFACHAFLPWPQQPVAFGSILRAEPRSRRCVLPTAEAPPLSEEVKRVRRATHGLTHQDLSL